MRRFVTPLLCALFFLSGVAALVFETLWFRQAGLAFGNGVWASSLVLSSFMAGLALGNGLAARWGGRLVAPLRAYAALEIAVALGGVALVFWLPALTPWLAPLFQTLQEPIWLQNAVRLGIGFALLLLPATAMGATLPVMVAALRARDASFGGALGLLYGWNTLGAVLGALLGELWLLEHWGVRGSAIAAGSFNLAAGAGALALAPYFAGTGSAPETTRPDASARRVLAAAFGAGAILLALEVVWFRFLHLFVDTSSAAFASMLAVVLGGIGLGGLAAGAWLRRRPEAWRHAPLPCLAAGVVTIGLYAFFKRASAPISGFDYASLVVSAWSAAVMTFPVALLSGALFPLLGAALARSLRPDAAAAGWLTLANTVGAALGALLAGFVLLPQLGLERSLFGLAAAYGGVAWLAAAPLPSRGARRVRIAAFAGFGVALALFPAGQMERYMRAPVLQWHARHEHEVLAVREGRVETALLVERRHAGERIAQYLVTNSFRMSATETMARRYMKAFVYWPVAVRPEPRSALLISYGVGSTAKALVDTPSLETIDVVDISQEILELAGVVFPRDADNPLLDPRVRVHVEDGRYFLEKTSRRFDLITGEPPPPKGAGVVNLYTREYFGRIRDRLTEGGVTTYWLPVHSLLEPEAKAILRAFCDVFDDCALWVGQGLDWMMTGSRGGTTAPSEAAFSRQWGDPVVAPELRALGFERPELLGATFLGDADWLRERTEGVPPLTDDRPGLLSHRPQRRPRVFFAWMDEEDAARRFRDSDYIRRTWPAALRERTERYFEVQRTVNAVTLLEPTPWPERIRDMHRLATAWDLPELAMWRIGITSDWVAAARSAHSGRRSVVPHAQAIASHSLVEGHFDDAARYFEIARRRAPRRPELQLLEAYSHCRADRPEAARPLLSAARRVPAALPEGVAWLEEICEPAEADPNGSGS